MLTSVFLNEFHSVKVVLKSQLRSVVDLRRRVLGLPQQRASLDHLDYSWRRRSASLYVLLVLLFFLFLDHSTEAHHLLIVSHSKLFHATLQVIIIEAKFRVNLLTQLARLDPRLDVPVTLRARKVKCLQFSPNFKILLKFEQVRGSALISRHSERLLLIQQNLLDIFVPQNHLLVEVRVFLDSFYGFLVVSELVIDPLASLNHPLAKALLIVLLEFVQMPTVGLPIFV